MLRLSLKRPNDRVYADFRRRVGQKAEAAALIASDRATRLATNEIRTAMRGAGLGRLSNSIGMSSDLSKGGAIKRRGANSFSASGAIFVRGRSERTLGAIESYTEGSVIKPRRARWLWIATSEIPSRVGRFKMTPARYRTGGLEARIGPLVEIPGRNRGERLLVVKSVTVRQGRRGSALSRKSRITKGREERSFIIAFVGIRSTSRRARIAVDKIIASAQAQMPRLAAEELAKG